MSEQAQHHEDQYLALSQDFQETFSTPAGQRVFRHLLNNVLLDKTPSVTLSPTGLIYPNADKGMYFVALSDVAKWLKNIMEYDFTSRQQRPVVHHRRPVPMKSPYRGQQDE
jgi:hypothetical protein